MDFEALCALIADLVRRNAVLQEQNENLQTALSKATESSGKGRTRASGS